MQSGKNEGLDGIHLNFTSAHEFKTQYMLNCIKLSLRVIKKCVVCATAHDMCIPEILTNFTTLRGKCPVDKKNKNLALTVNPMTMA